ncbi:hypothetical protein HLV37_02730 [Eggerthellaceae bacterium zg-1084]|uniref:Uncharacterized protein n=1 Tax=Berryella wangjianweii TaxID=2734634 RepID=A0A6M8J485_9ACTN|nr:hypothetical protein [Berryella wangjianweii]NPD30794.1 hypothetical protein [Berryella wangjianweii]NPD31987.1 hypothetical protein [Eggerthellaceae bacterium zg-997]QKF07423.1 hypothetical protein HLV38_04295 [Berryella wangjianweii]
MVEAIALGILAGILGFLPLALAQRGARRATGVRGSGSITMLLLGTLSSSLVLGACTAVCLLFFRDVALPFALAEFGALVAAAVSLSVYQVYVR